MQTNQNTLRGTEIEKALLAADPKLGTVIEGVIARFGVQRPMTSKSSRFEALVRAIVYQRMSAAAAERIYRRLRETVGGRMTPRKVLGLPEKALRSAGFSDSKATYVRNLAEWFEMNKAKARHLPGMTDDEVVTTLIAIKGVGRWTANVFLIFNLQRLDVMPADDLGIRQGVRMAYDLKKLPSAGFVEKISHRWKPFRSIACMYLWKAAKLP